MRNDHKTATLKDVAREAGFSVMTVSHVLNGRLNQASPGSREKIFAAARRLNYRPNLNARTLVTRKRNVIGLLLDSGSPWFYRDVMMVLERLSFRRQYRLQVGLVHDSLDSIRHYIDDFKGTGVEDVICLAHSYPEFGTAIPEMLRVFRNVVFMEMPLAATAFPVVATDHYRNYHDATATLLAAGLRRIYSFRMDFPDCSFSEGRRGMRDAYREAGADFREEFWWLCGSLWWQSLDEARRELEPVLAKNPDALIIANDEAMLWTLQVLQERGIAVPGDLSLFSADLWRYGRAARPTFSGIDYQAEHLAERLMARLMQGIDGTAAGGEPAVELIPARIQWGESSRGGVAAVMD